MWLRTVSVLMWSSWAICLVEYPCSRSRSTWAWRREIGVWLCGRLLGLFDQLPEDAYDVSAVHQRHRTDLHNHSCSIGRYQDSS